MARLLISDIKTKNNTSSDNSVFSLLYHFSLDFIIIRHCNSPCKPVSLRLNSNQKRDGSGKQKGQNGWILILT